MKATPLALDGALVFEPRVFPDARGRFLETWSAERYAAHGVGPFVQDNHSRSVRGVLRGLHYQLRRPQGKLVYAVRGAVYDVLVDLRRSSPTFGRWAGVALSDEDHRQVWVPPGFAHGFYVTSDVADVVYKCTEAYSPADERSVLWSDPDLAIAWPLAGPPLVSAKDAAAPCFREAEVYE